MMKEATLLVKIVSLAYLVLVLLGIYFALTNYQLVLVGNRLDRESLVLGDSLLAATCIAETTPDGFGIKGLLSERKIIDEETAPQPYESHISCLRYPKPVYVEIYQEDARLHSFGDVNVLGVEGVYNNSFPAVLNTTGGVVPVRFTLFVPP